MDDNDGIREILNVVNGHGDIMRGIREQVDTLGAKVDTLTNKVDGLDKKVDAIDGKVDAIATKLDEFSADTQDEFSIIKARLRNLERGKGQ